ncbi:purine-nucleoside phosphorylase [Sediminibacterium sp. KACHI17]|uniref:Purine nucleoside phosphorylase n=2 Tax=Sediminibacterium sp. KACHI17 TaxID=1751071 RepID=A0AAT9GJ37_9BACT
MNADSFNLQIEKLLVIMENMLQKVDECASFLREKGFQNPEVAVVLGTGLGSFIQHIDISLTIPYHEIPHFPTATVEFHKGQLIYGTVQGKKVMAMQGRFHYYEGYSMQQITFPIRVMKALGIQFLLLSNAAGGMNPLFKKGDMVLINDHINLLPENPLRGLNDPAFGNRFVDMCKPYDDGIGQQLIKAAHATQKELLHGVYVAVQGPNLETRAEYRYLRAAGADMVGMSTVPEVIVANHIGLRCAAVSVITDECDPDHLQPVNISEIIEVAGRADEGLSAIFAKAIGTLK